MLTNEVKGYIDGELIFSVSNFAGWNTTNRPLVLGCNTEENPSATSNTWDGYIYDVRLYDHVLSTKEAVELSKAKCGHWKLDTEGSVNDCSGYGNHGVIAGSPIWHSGGPAGLGYYEFDGSSDYIDLSGTDATWCSNITVAFWVYTPSIDSGRYFLGNGAQFRFRFAGTKAYFWIREENSGSTSEINGGTVSAGAWYHIAGTWDGTNQILYVNGSSVKLDTPSLGDMDIGSDNFTIGWAYKNSGQDKFNGYLSDVRVYARALTSTQIEELYK